MNLFDIDKSHCVTTEHKLLWNIKELLSKEEKPEVDMVPEEKPVSKAVKKVVEKISKEKTKKGYTCKTCGEVYDNTGGMLACARKHKKESV